MFGNSIASGYKEVVMGNPFITWETSTNWNMGVDLGLLDNRLNVAFDWYKKITDDIDVFEREMPYEYVPGVMDFIAELKAKGVPRAVVTSSNRKKMENVYARHPEFRSMFDRIFTGEDFARSKPAPDCYLLGMDTFGAAKKSTVIFEDSFSGLKSARDSGGFVVGLATTNSREAITPLADLVIDDFTRIDTERLLASMS